MVPCGAGMLACQAAWAKGMVDVMTVVHPTSQLVFGVD
jgi:hypothetical protein